MEESKKVDDQIAYLQNKLEESELLSRKFIMQAPHGICILNAETLMTEIVNDAYLEITGKSRKAVETEHHWVTFKEAADHFAPILDEVIKTGVAFHIDEVPVTLIRSGKPELVYLSFVYEPIKDSRGVVTKIMTTGLDVTTKVLSRKKVERSEQNLRNTILQAPVAMAILRGPEYIVEIANDRMFELWGRSAETLINKPVFAGLPEAQNQGFEEILNNVYNKGESFTASGISVRLPREGGVKTIYFDVLYEPYCEENGEISGIVAVAIDITDQIKSKQKLEESEQKYRTLFESMDQGFCLIEIIFDGNNKPADYRFLELNPMFESQTGLKDAEGKTALELLPDLERKWIEIYGNVATSGEPYRFVEGSDVMGRWFDVYAFKIGDAQSKKVALLFSDITDRQRTALENERYLQQLEEAKDQLDFAIEAAQLGTWDFNPTRNKVSGNKRLKEWFGLDPHAEFDLSVPISVIIEEDRQRVIDAIQNALQYSSGGHYDIEYTIVNPKTNQRRIVNAKGRAWFNDEKVAYRFNGTLEDITSKALAQREIEEAKELQFKRFEKIANSLPQIVWTAEPNGCVDYFNDRWFAYTGLSLEESRGEGWKSAIHPDDLPEVNRQWGYSLATGQLYQAEARIRNKMGVYNWILMRASAVFENERLISQWCGSYTLIQDQKESEQRLQILSTELTAANEEISATNDDLVRLNDELMRVNSDMDNFIYTASHDLKAPISNIEGLIMALKRHISKDSLANPMVVKLFPMIQASIDRFKKTLLDLTEITKLQRIDQDEEKFVDVMELIDDIKLDLSEIIEESNAKIEAELNGITSLKFSSKNLRSIFYNLLSNSLKYRSPERTPLINIKGGEEGEYYVFSVKDNGLGMNLSNKNSIFGMFKRLHNHVDGSGIGLYIVKKIIDNAGGKIEVESKVDEGSVFKLYFRKSLDIL